jgi:hypothetical protein
MRMMLFAALAVAALGVVASGDPKGGYWCWTHEDGASSLCAPQQDQCEAALEGFNSTSTSLGDKPSKNTCKWQKAAWALIPKGASSGDNVFPTQKLCNSARSKGDRCKQVK